MEDQFQILGTSPNVGMSTTNTPTVYRAHSDTCAGSNCEVWIKPHTPDPPERIYPLLFQFSDIDGEKKLHLMFNIEKHGSYRRLFGVTNKVCDIFIKWPDGYERWLDLELKGCLLKDYSIAQTVDDIVLEEHIFLSVKSFGHPIWKTK